MVERRGVLKAPRATLLTPMFRSPRRRPQFPRLLRRSDSLLGLLAFILAALILAYVGGWTEPLRLIQGEEPIPAESASEALEPHVSDRHIPQAGAPVRFLMHNVANYFVAGEQQRSRYTIKPKPLKSREAVAELIASQKPDIVGLIEMGGPMALADLRERLAARGEHYPYYRVLIRQGEDRALTILSRHPIVQDNSRASVKLYGSQRRRMLRGILDVTVRMKDGRLFRIMGAHLKSRVSDDPAAANALRAKEAHTLAEHVHEAMRRQPNMPLLVYGDWNDGPADASIRILAQGLSTSSALSRLKPEDSRGEAWTHYYKGANEYYTFDQIYVNKVLEKRMGRKGKEQGGIVDSPAAADASDHRAVWCELR